MTDMNPLSTIEYGHDEQNVKKRTCCDRRRFGLLLPCLLIVVIAVIITLAVVLSSNKDGTTTHKQKMKNNFTVVQTKLGKIEGKIYNIAKDNGQLEEVYEFKNIPYALPPIDALRWRPPVALNSSTTWKGVLEYTEENVQCKHRWEDRIGKEDCLILTVRQPKTATKKNPLPVLFWIHGGGLTVGSSSWYYPDAQCSASIEMVTVSINYRLNLFGFLSIKEIWMTSSKEKLFGNFGIMDMIVALEWVRDNIGQFGGDPDRVTILGESGGGAAVYSLIVSPLASGLFHKAIPASGYQLNPRTTYKRADRRYGNMFKEDTNCSKSSPEEVMKCLRNLTADQVLDNLPEQKHPMNESLDPWIFPTNDVYDDYPIRVLDPLVLPHPLGMLTSAPIPALEILIGNTAQEGSPEEQAESWESLRKYITPRIDGFKDGLYPTVLKLYKERRSKDKVTPVNMTSQYVYTTMTSDVLLSCITNDISRNLSHVPNVTIYRYVASQPFSTKSWDKFEPMAYHSIDTDAFFGYLNGNITQNDRKLMLNFRKVFKDFAYGEKEFRATYEDKTIEFWDGEVITWDKPYHEEECKIWRDYGFLKRSWGQLG